MVEIGYIMFFLGLPNSRKLQKPKHARAGIVWNLVGGEMCIAIEWAESHNEGILYLSQERNPPRVIDLLSLM